MTGKERAELKGELFGLQVLVMQSLCFIAARTDDPLRHLEVIRDSAVAGIAVEPKADVLSRYFQTFQAAAAHVVVQCVGAAQEMLVQDGVLPANQGKVSGGV